MRGYKVTARIGLAALAAVAAPAASTAAPTTAPSAAIGPARLPGLPTFIDGVVAQQIATREVAGAVVTFVYQWRALFSRGYGYADIASGRRVDPAVSFTGGPGSSSARTLLRDAILGRVFPQAPAPRWTGNAAGSPLGRYRSNRLDYSKPADPVDDLMLGSPKPHLVTIGTGASATAWEQVGSGRYEEVTGGPFDQIQFYGTAADPRLQIPSHPYETHHLVKAN